MSLGTAAPLGAQEYATFLGEEYLSGYVPAGGASVKVVVVGDGDVADRFDVALAEQATEQGCLLVRLSAETTKMHMIDQVFFAVARQVDWRQVASAVLASAYDAIALPAAPGYLSVAEVAAEHDVDARELYRSVRRQLERTLLSDPALAREMRRAVLRLAQARLGGADVTAAEEQAVLGWLQGEKVSLRELRTALIHSRIGRHNARSMLASLSQLLLRTETRGLVLRLDLTRLAESRRPPVAERSGTYYSKAAVLDAYELLRQLIDSTDELRGLLAVAVIPAELVTDEARGLPAYGALQLRVADEVRDQRRANPFAALVRLDVRLEAVR
jgi:transposase-like protein